MTEAPILWVFVKYVSLLVWGLFVGIAAFVFQTWLRGLSLPNLPLFLSVFTENLGLLIFVIALWGVIARVAFRQDALRRLRDKVWFYKPRWRLRPLDVNPSESWYTARLINRPVEQAIGWFTKNQEGGVLLTGVPLIGKTRCAYEILKRINGHYHLGIGPYDDISEIKLPRSYVFLKPKVVLFLDDLQDYIGKFHPNRLHQRLSKQTRSLSLLATCRTGPELQKVLSDQSLGAWVRQNLHRVNITDLTEEEEQELAAYVGRAWTPTLYNGTPGSIVFDLDDMRKRLDSANTEARTLMRTLFLMRRAGISIYRRKLVEQAARSVYELSADRVAVENGWRTLAEMGFLTIARGKVVPTHAVYFEGGFWPHYELFDVQEDDETLWQLVLTEQVPPELLEMSVHRALNGDYKGALDGFCKYLTLIPTDTGVLFLTGGALFQLAQDERSDGKSREAERKLHNAERTFREALALDPEDANLHYVLAGVLDAQNKSELEIQHELREAIRCDPDFAEAHFALGARLHSQRKTLEAKQEYLVAVRCDPTYPSPHYGLHALLLAEGRTEDAKEELREFNRLQAEDNWRTDP